MNPKASEPPRDKSTAANSYFRSCLLWLQQMRKRLYPILRFCWRFLLVLLILAQLLPDYRDPALGIWTTLNICYAMVACLWAAFHWRPLWAARDISLRWSVCLSLAVTLACYSYISATQYKPDGLPSALQNTGIFWFLMIIIALLLLCLLTALGLLGAAVSAFAARKIEDTQRAAQVGVHSSMLALLATLLAAYWLTPNNDDTKHYAALYSAICCSFPLMTRAYWHWWLPDTSRPARQQAIRSLRRAWERLFLWRRRLRTRTLVVDLRGVALGLCIAVILLKLPSRLVGPLQSQAFTFLSHARAVILGSQTSRAQSQGPHITIADDAAERAKQGKRAQDRQHIAILHLDDSTRHAISAQSEIAIQSEMIDRLQKMGAACIVLPMPYLYNKAYPVWSSFENPAPQEQDANNNRRDARQFVTILHRSPSVVLALPASARRQDAKVKLVVEAIPQYGEIDLPVSPTTYLPMVPTDWPSSSPPISTLAYAAMTAPQGHAKSASPFQRLQDIPGGALPHITPEGVLVDFVGIGPHEDFLHISYAAVHANSLLPVQNISHPLPDDQTEPPEPTHNWKPVSELLRGRIVFLDSMAHPVRNTPLGVMTQSEEQAYAVSTLLSGESLERITRFDVPLVLFLGLLVGYLCVQKEPIDAILQVAVPFVMTLLGCIIAFIIGRWIDPVLPLLTILITLMLATQMRFAHERADKTRTSELFGRFVAPHMVQEWLSQSEEELGLGGKREKLCVLFADVRDFTPFAERHDASEVIDIINAYMTAITDALHAYNGVLDKYTGDGLMAFFQSARTPQKDTQNSMSTLQMPQTMEQDVSRAVHAALAMRDAALALSVKRREEGKPTLDLGFSLHYGEAVVGLVGNIKQQINYTALGHTVVVAARLQTIASGGDVVVSEAVFQETQEMFVFAVGEPVYVKGLSTPVRPYYVLAPREAALSVDTHG